MYTIKVELNNKANEIRFKYDLALMLDTLNKRPGQSIVLAIDELDSGFKVQIGNGVWSAPVYGTIEKD